MGRLCGMGGETDGMGGDIYACGVGKTEEMRGRSNRKRNREVEVYEEGEGINEKRDNL